MSLPSITVDRQANDVKLRNNRVVRFAHSAVVNGTGHLIHANHFFQGDDAGSGLRRAGLIFTQTNISTVVTGNYIDNCFIEWGNEHDVAPEWTGEFSFGGLNIVGNVFIASNTTTAFRFVVIRPYGSGHYLNGFSLVSNSFRVINNSISRVDMVDTTYAALNPAQMRNVRIEGNSFNNVSQPIMNPVTVSHSQNSVSEAWNVDAGTFVPFGGRIRMVESIVPEGAIVNGASQIRYAAPYATPGTGTSGTQAQLRWGEAVRGKAIVSMRMDVPS